MGEIVEASADVALGEAIRPAAEASARVYRGELAGTFILALPFVGGIIAGSMAGMVVSWQFPQWGSWPTSVLSLLGMTLGLYFGLRLYSRRHLTGFLAGLRRMGSPELFATRFRFDEQAIAIDNDRLSHRIAWPAVLFIVSSKDHWLVQVDTLTIAVPRRAFADATAEQGFLALALECMTDESRGRSVFKTQ
jgi:hypothetical protein